MGVVLAPHTTFAPEKIAVRMAALSLVLATILLTTSTLATPIVDRPGTAQGASRRELDSIGGGNILRHAPKSLDSSAGATFSDNSTVSVVETSSEAHQTIMYPDTMGLSKRGVMIL